MRVFKERGLQPVRRYAESERVKAAGDVFTYTVFLGSIQLSFLATLAAGRRFAAEFP
jgi:hypothetical protein